MISYYPRSLKCSYDSQDYLSLYSSTRSRPEREEAPVIRAPRKPERPLGPDYKNPLRCRYGDPSGTCRCWNCASPAKREPGGSLLRCWSDDIHGLGRAWQIPGPSARHPQMGQKGH